LPKSRVALVRCDDYDEERVYEAVSRGVALLGGVSSFVGTGEKIVLKPNILIGSNPDKCVTTHPAVVRAAGLLLQQAGARVSWGDSPGVGGLEFNARLAGIKQVADRLGFERADFAHGREVTHHAALLAKKFTLANGVLDADGLVSLPKLKTHGLMRLTGAVKNQFGCIPGVLKGQFHAKMADPYQFATMLVDINTFIRPRLYVMDAITAMEGNGPRNGTPRQMNALLVSTDPIALDAVACALIALDPEHVPTSQPGERSGLGTYHRENIEVVGGEVADFALPDFEVVREPPATAVEGRLRTLLRDLTTPRPVIDPAICNGCGTCVRMCPVGPSALDWMRGEAGKMPGHHYRHCIRCYCCQEVCPEGAITVKKPLLSRVIFGA
jgi:uncharacterized protein (DUF362 family)/NAD-dependent dihydropyrimidine dehydrogenase PreA subunit